VKLFPPLSLSEFIGLRGWQVVGSELLWVWLPAAVAFVIIAIATAGRRTTTPVKN
jgi:inner membrane protein